jgi:hypothetical protein
VFNKKPRREKSRASQRTRVVGGKTGKRNNPVPERRTYTFPPYDTRTSYLLLLPDCEESYDPPPHHFHSQFVDSERNLLPSAIE